MSPDHAAPLPFMRSSLAEGVHYVRAESGCWIWQGPKDIHGYGRTIGLGRSFSQRAHRASYEIAVGPIPEGLVMDHLCRNPPCINPAHLEPVTSAENVRRGLNAQINAEIAEDIRRRIVAGQRVYDIAAELDLNPWIVRQVADGDTWNPAGVGRNGPRVLPQRICPACGTEIVGGRRDKTYCNRTCKQRAYERRSQRHWGEERRNAA